MPKTLEKSSSTRVHLQSAKQSSAQQAETGPGPSNWGVPDEYETTGWRESTVAEDAVISKNMAFKQYRLTPQDLEDLPFETKPGQLGGYPCNRYLYRERDIERKAWERHGGPEGFDAYLTVLRNRYDTRAKKPGKWVPFRQPKSYDVVGL